MEDSGRQNGGTAAEPGDLTSSETALNSYSWGPQMPRFGHPAKAGLEQQESSNTANTRHTGTS
jgi:hypothetical protein